MADELTNSTSRRVTEARSRAESRREAQRGWLRPMGFAIVAVVVVAAFDGEPAPALHGRGLGVTLSLVVYAVGLAIALRPVFNTWGPRAQVALIVAIGAASIALSGFETKATEIAPAVAVFTAMLRLPLRLGVAIGAAITIGLAITSSLQGDSSSAAVGASALLCVTLGLMAYFVRQSREGQDRTELLMAELEDARDTQAQAAALAERARIAGDLHDVLAHSLSGAAIQLQGARKLADRDDADPELRTAVDRASELVKEGLSDARRAVDALRGGEIPSVEQIAPLVESFRSDMNVDVTLTVEGEPRPLAPDASLALYRGAQEALTNVARYAPGATAAVVLSYAGNGATLSIEDRVANPRTASSNDLSGVGGGHGLAGMRERVEQAGGRMEAGPTGDGWCVRLEVPA
jgi:signal transduction histidine kinase